MGWGMGWRTPFGVALIACLAASRAVAAEPGLAVMARLVAPEPAVRAAAARAAGGAGRAVFLDPLLSALADPDVGVRRAAVEALGALG
ncbi:MAG: HEAT repeat domain-containing protein, partial [Myxococcales bacterium]|nr:HEAT repeat domain-containing protein [Myxococcales bacterium]